MRAWPIYALERTSSLHRRCCAALLQRLSRALGALHAFGSGCAFRTTRGARHAHAAGYRDALQWSSALVRALCCMTNAHLTGGHTTEMLALVRALPNEEFSPRTYYVSSGDAYSVGKAAEFEASRYGCSSVHTVELPRARAVGQSWLTTPLSVMFSLLFCVWHMAVRPLVEPGPEPFADVVLMNGPGTCVTICMAVWTLRVLSLIHI